MKYLFILTTILIISCNSYENKNGETSNSSPVHFNGIYKSAIQTNQNTGDKSTSYLRFYEDGTVINVSSSGTPEQINNWFVKGHENVTEAPYKIEGDKMSFTSGSGNAAVEYSGKIVTSALLQLHTKSLSNNFEDDVTYTFAGE